jgi:hypothetical protein
MLFPTPVVLFLVDSPRTLGYTLAGFRQMPQESAVLAKAVPAWSTNVSAEVRGSHYPFPSKEVLEWQNQ